MAWVNGRGCQRACSYRHIAAVAEMSVASCLNRARQAMALLLPVLISRTAGYAIRMSGGVGGGGREVTPYPYIYYHIILLQQSIKNTTYCA
jgi:hypothetical protein